MRIRKEYQVIPTNAKLENGDSTSATNGYTADYINNHSVVVSPTEPSGSARKKVWLRHSSNLFVNYTKIENANINSSGTITSDVSFDLYYIPCKPSTTYNIKYGNIVENKIVISSYENIPAVGSTGNSRWVATGQTTYTTRSNDNYLVVRDAKNLENITAGIFITEEAPYVQDKEYILNENNVYEEFKPQNEVYSTEEVRIGTWLGKPLYRKVLTGTMPSNAFVDIPINVSNIDISNTMVETGYTKTSNGTRPIPFINTSIDTTIAAHPIVSNNTNYIRVATNTTNYSGYQFYIPIRYTKTTD